MGFHQIDERNQALLSKIALDDGHGENSPYFDGWKAYDNDPFHPENNPLGVIQMGLAENQVWYIVFSCFCYMTSRLKISLTLFFCEFR